VFNDYMISKFQNSQFQKLEIPAAWLNNISIHSDLRGRLLILS